MEMLGGDIVWWLVKASQYWNPSQWYEIFTNRGADLVKMRIQQQLQQDSSAESYAAAFDTLVEYAHDCNKHWAEVIVATHTTPTARKEFVHDVLKERLYIWMPPGIADIDQHWVKRMAEKWGIDKTPVTFTIQGPDAAYHTVTTKKPVLIGAEYFYLLYKIPHLRCCNIGHINQNRSPVRPSALAKREYPISQAATRFGEDEMRNIVMTAGAETAAYILGVYANSYDAVMNLGRHLLTDKVPSQLQDIDYSLTDIIKSNNIIGLTKHIFSCLGVNIAPTKEEIQQLLVDKDTIDTVAEVDDRNGEKISDD